MASALLLLAAYGVWDLGEGESTSQDSRMKRAWSHFSLFCTAEGLSPSGIRSFSRSKLHCGTKTNPTFPFVGCKGSDTVLLLKFLSFVATMRLADAGPALSERLSKLLLLVQMGARAGLSFTQGIYVHGIWLERSCVIHLRRALRDFTSAYSQLAFFSLAEGHTLFGMVPKLHALCHFKKDFEDSLKRGKALAISPGVYDCAMGEDYIGKIAKLSRRVAYKRGHFERSILRVALVKAKSVLNKFCKDRGLKA